MRNKPLGALIWVTLALLVIWLATMIVMNVSLVPITTYEQALAFATERHWLYFQLNYVNASIYSMPTRRFMPGYTGCCATNTPLPQRSPLLLYRSMASSPWAPAWPS